jgi:hypothetical protein
MPQQLQNLSIAAPAFKGLNTQDSPLMSDPSFAAVADNCVIDQYGRIGARKGFDVITTDNTPLGSTEITSMGYFEDVVVMKRYSLLLTIKSLVVLQRLQT